MMHVRVMWDRVIADLVAAGYRQEDIARRVGLSAPSIVDLKRGRQRSVKWEVGARLLALAPPDYKIPYLSESI